MECVRRIGYLSLALLILGCSGEEDTVGKIYSEVERVEVRNNLKLIGLASHHHYELYGSFLNAPPKGKGLSWRVHLLPYMEENSLYQQFNLDEPWDSPHNKKLIALMPKVYRRPNGPKDGKTTIHVFVGEGTPFGLKQPLKFRAITDGTSRTIMAIDAASSTAVEWTKPGGLQFDRSNPSTLTKYLRPSGTEALFFSGAVKPIPAGISTATLGLLIQHADNQPIPEY